MYAGLDIAGNQPISDWFEPDTTQRHTLGFILNAVDPYWGGAEFVYGKASGTVPKGTLTVFDQAWNAAGVPSTAGQSFPVQVAVARMEDLTFGWFARSGFHPVRASGAAMVAGDSVGLGASGVAAAVTAGKQVMGLRLRFGQASTKVLTGGQTTNGSAVLYFPNGYDGFFLGISLSGTGIPASTVASKMGSDGKTIIMGSAAGTVGDKLATATGSVSITGTYTNFILAQIQAPMTQSQIV